MGIPAAVAAGVARGRPAGASQGRPDIVVVMTDDQALSTVGPFGDAQAGTRVIEGGEERPLMRRLMNAPGGGWVNFRRAVCTHAICAPSRATMLTGLYSRHHGVMRNGWVRRMDGDDTLAAWLNDAGYYCAFKGKYSYGKQDGNTPRPAGWNVWEPGGGLSAAVFPWAVDVIRHAPADRPLFLCAWPVDPHRPQRVQPQYTDAEIALPGPSPNVYETDFSDKPEKMRKSRPFTGSKLAGIRNEQAEAARALLGVDDGIEMVFEALIDAGRWENTVFVFLGDHGYMWGEHGLARSKDNPYREAIYFPLLIRDPAGIGKRDEYRMVGNIDLAATLADLSGASPGRAPDGRSLVSLMRDGEARESTYLIEKPTPTAKDTHTWRGVYAEVGGGTACYVEHDTGEVELYDMTVDPWQMESAHERPEYAGMRAELRARLEALAG